MVVLGVPSMFSACFPDSFMEDWGVTIFLICASLMALLLSFMYIFWLSGRFQVSLSGPRVILFSVFMAFGLSCVPCMIYSLITVQKEYFSICIIIMSVLFLSGMLLILPTKEGFRFKKLSHLWQAGLILLTIGASIYSVGILLSFNLLLMIIGSIYFILGIVIEFISILIGLYPRIKHSIKLV